MERSLLRPYAERGQYDGSSGGGGVAEGSMVDSRDVLVMLGKEDFQWIGA